MGTVSRLLVLLLTSVLAGCASMPEPIEPTATVDRSKGILLAGVTSDGNPQVMDTWFFYRRKGTSEEKRLDAFGLVLWKPNDFAGKDSQVGRLIALPLDPGEYELFNWMLYVYRLGGYAYLSPKTPPQPHTFTIVAGTITYLGGLHVDTILSKNLFGISLPFGGNPDIADKLSRDLPLLKSKYPNLASWPIQSSVPDGTKWRLPQ